MPMRVLTVGGVGSIGSHLTGLLVKNYHRVRMLDRLLLRAQCGRALLIAVPGRPESLAGRACGACHRAGRSPDLWALPGLRLFHKTGIRCRIVKQIGKQIGGGTIPRALPDAALAVQPVPQ